MSWLSDASANRIIQCYAKNFLDVSGNFKVRNDVATVVSGNPSDANWTQLGSDIIGEAVNDYSGVSVSLSSDGTIVAIGADGNDGNGDLAGHVRVYEYSGGSWSQLGSDIDGEAAGDRFGHSVSLSSDGTILAAGGYYNDGANGSDSGHVRVYEYSGGSWSQLGSDIDGEAANDRSGRSVSLSSDGTIVAIGAFLNDGNGSNSGHVRVYQYSGGSWSQLGSDIDGEAASNYSGHSVSLSSDGTILAIGAYGNADNGYLSGHVRVYQYANSTWSQLGSDLDGLNSYGRAGQSVSLSSDGTILAMSSHTSNGGNVGYVQVYQYSNSTWTQLGSDLDGEAEQEYFGSSVSLSSDGTILVVGAYGSTLSTSSNYGSIRVYQYANSTWNQIGSTVYGSRSSESFGTSVSLSSDGSKVAAGATGVSSSRGAVRVYDGGFGSTVSITNNTQLDVSGGTVSIVNSTMEVSDAVVDMSGTTWMNRGQSGASVASAYQKGLVIESSKSTSSDNVIYVETAGQTQAFSVRADGAMYSANTLRHSSDDRRKINEQLITGATETINKLSPQIYTKLDKFEEDGGTPKKTESGLIAQEVYYNAPELRHLIHTDGEPQPYDLSGIDLQTDPDYNALGWGPKSATINYIGLLPYLIKSNQEQQEIIDNKQQQIADNKTTLETDIQSRIAALES